MKRIITFLLLFAFAIPHGVSAQIADLFDDSTSDGQISLKLDTDKPYVYSTINISIDKNPLLDFTLAQIVWVLNGKTIGRSGIGADTYSFYFNDLNPIELSVRAQTPNGRVYTAKRTITPYLAQISLDPKVELGLFRTTKPTKVEIRTIPASIRAFQRVEFIVEPIDKKNILTDKIIYWYVDGKQASPGIIGDTKLIIRLANPSASTTVSVNVVDGTVGNVDSVTFLPKSDPRLRLQTSQASRLLNCEANASRMIYNDIQRLKIEENKIYSRSKEAIEIVTKDKEFLENTYDYILTDLAATAKTMGDMGLKLISSLFSGDFKTTGKDAVALGKYINENTTIARVVYIKNQIDYYAKLLKWYEKEPNRIKNQIESAKKQIEYQQKRCEEIANKKPDLSLGL